MAIIQIGHSEQFWVLVKFRDQYPLNWTIFVALNVLNKIADGFNGRKSRWPLYFQDGDSNKL